MKETPNPLKFNLATPLAGRDGVTIKRTADTDMTLRDAILDSIDARHASDGQPGSALSFNGLTRLYCLVSAAEGEVELTAEQVTLACDRAALIFGPGQLHLAILKLLNPAVLKAA